MPTVRNTEAQLIQELATNKSFRALVAVWLDAAGTNDNSPPLTGTENYLFAQGFKAFGQRIQNNFQGADIENYLLMLKENHDVK